MSERSSSQAGAQPSSKHTRARDVLFEDFEEGMVSPTEDQEGSPGAGHSPQSCSRSRSPARPPPRSPLRTPNPFPERDTGAPALRNAPPLPSRDDAEGSNVNTNDLDGAQSRQLEVRREASKSNIPAALPLVKKSKDYHFGGSKSPAKEATELAKDSLVEYVIGPAARSDKELAKRDTWCKRLLTPQTTSPAEYCARLDAQLAKSSVPQINRIPVVLLRGEDEVEDDVNSRTGPKRPASYHHWILFELVIASVIFIWNDAFASCSQSGRLASISPGQGPRSYGASSSTLRRQRLLRIRRRYRTFLRLGLAPGSAGRPTLRLRACRAPRVLPIKSVDGLRAVLS
ncbi:hypothetical protein PF003_g28914 [Phytophthora fragariae]|nr:hypothetical protein PF003_g28914 [Phytophthora fragariae]